MEMENDSLILEDWKMTNDRIKHFDGIIIRLRLGGIPIASAIIGAGLASFKYTSTIMFSIASFTINATSIVILLGAFCLIPICALDMFYYWLLQISVDHAREIEEKIFKAELITTKLTKRPYTIVHTAIAIFTYIAVILTAFGIAYAVNISPS